MPFNTFISMLLYDAVFIRLERLFGLYENQSAFFLLQIAGLVFYIGRGLSLNILMNVYNIFKMGFLMSF